MDSLTSESTKDDISVLAWMALGRQGRETGCPITPMSKRTALQRQLVGPAGEHYVLYRLHFEGMLAALAPRNAPSVDILVLHDDETIAATIQVKARTYGTDRGWHMKSKHENLVRKTLFYAFVDFEAEQPVTYVVPSSVVARVVRESHAAWLATPGKKGQAHNDNEMRRIMPAYSFEVPTVSAGWLEEFKERWDLIRSSAVVG